MLTITIPGEEYYDELNETFTTHGDVKLKLQHSLLSLSKWESKYRKPFLGPGEKSSEEVIGYIKAMVVSDEIDDETLNRLTPKNLTEINDYIESTYSATTFSNNQRQVGRSEVITSELIYYWMITFNIPFECETWHLNRLFALIRICNIKNTKPKKMSKSEVAARNRELNAMRKAQLGTSG